VFAPEADITAVAGLRHALKLTAPVARVLVRRGYSRPDDAERFLAKRLSDLRDPFLLPDMGAAASRLAEAVRRRERVVLFGDYDVDGLSSTALMADFLSLAGGAVTAMVPERNEGGYGLTEAAVQRIFAAEPKLVVTLDNGIGAHAAVKKIKAAGVGCVIVDHHHVGAAGLPCADAVVNPWRTDAGGPFPEFCAAGLAFKLAWATAQELSQAKRVTPEFRAFLLRAAALAGLGTIADVAPLADENRILAALGLQSLRTIMAPGLRALMDVCKVRGEPTAHDVAFRLGPRLNASGRIGQAADALRLLLTKDAAEAKVLAEKLDRLNQERRTLENRVFREAVAKAHNQLRAPNAAPLFCLADADWHAGVIGIVASRLTETFHRPTVLLTTDDKTGLARGSGRSIPGFHLAEAFGTAAAHALSFGGHAAAAGVTLAVERVDDFRIALENAARKIPAALLEPKLLLDDVLDHSELTPALCADLKKLEPCGAGNPSPIFALRRVALCNPPRLMGADEKHLSFFFRDGCAKSDRAVRAVGFNFGPRFNELCAFSDQTAATEFTDLAGVPALNEFNGQCSVELFLKDFRPAVG
jgi:single-stranded-DNA-specific exonuclease